MSKGLVIVISAPSGGGKGTILKKLFESDDNLTLSVSATTRAPRPGEENGVQYYFVTKEEFSEMLEKGEILEHAEFCDNYYGTPKAPVVELTEKGKDVVLEIEVKGGAQIKKLIPDCVSIFITPVSLEVLEKRLRNRGTETEDAILKRLATAKVELKEAHNYDYIVVNDKLEDAVEDVKSILRAEKLRYIRNKENLDSSLGI
ncbi:MAG: guanylate kinase [Ruminococcaceae bacterium]|nr:guanylate kinase [Oscillospiraceae bacterium]